jgi:hypothetical protein
MNRPENQACLSVEFRSHERRRWPWNRLSPNAVARLGVRSYIGIALGLLLIRLCLMPIASSLWLDELGTSWITSSTLSEAINRSLSWHGQSVLYMIVSWLFQAVAGSSEVALRTPSLIAYLLAVVLLYRIGKRLLDAEAGMIALVPFVAATSNAACDARPYALALLASLGAAWFLIEWLDSGGLSKGILYALLSAMTVYFHFLFALMWVPHLLYALSRMRGGSPVTAPQLASISLLTSALVGPMVPQLLALRGSPLGTYRPPFLALFQKIAPEYLAVAILTGALVSILWLRTVSYSPSVIRQSDRWFILSWALFPQLFLFAVSWVFPTKVFIPRYWSSAAPGLGFLIAWVIRDIEPARARASITLAMAASAFILDGGVGLKVRHNSENWRDAMAAVRATAATDTPVLLRSGFIEGGDRKFFLDPRNAAINLIPLTRYPGAGLIIPLGYSPDEPTLRDLDTTIRTRLLETQRFLLVSKVEQSGFGEWLEGRLYSAGFKSRSLGDFGTVSVMAFERGPSISKDRSRLRTSAVR